MDDTDTGYKLFVGHQFNNGLGLDIGYLNLGEVDLTISGEYDDASAFLDSVRHTYPLSADGFFWAGDFNWYFYDSLSLLVRVGVFVWDSDYRTTSLTSGETTRDSRSGSDRFWRVGGQYDLTTNWSLQASWERFDLGGNDVDFVSAGLMYRFGWPLVISN
jgi:OOP family OmpA-OmpF porin